ncbi:hypothetical protein CYLTODRAFT_454991 [Cylindrobasidium torrendii FP15055 ss-10]|uniref:RING-type domain-containing protein n=1 Tax=Cylindrobasidium torrendii FP15055 ss-10 TaxID=1314674 RepID=A0A0D7B8G4_9AGAR|nr:hypothetical protein CYLTODRAFT_454991 [Cylindrobasidium torrendii FP15055 ss-10]
MTDYLRVEVEKGMHKLLCPNCKSSNAEIFELSDDVALPLLTEKLCRRLRTNRILQMGTSVECPKCTRSMLFVDKDKLDKHPVLTCIQPCCNHSWCYNCNIHIKPAMGVGARIHERRCVAATDPIFQQARQEGWKQCPGCNAMVEKGPGCNHIQVESKPSLRFKWLKN